MMVLTKPTARVVQRMAIIHAEPLRRRPGILAIADFFTQSSGSYVLYSLLPACADADSTISTLSSNETCMPVMDPNTPLLRLVICEGTPSAMAAFLRSDINCATELNRALMPKHEFSCILQIVEEIARTNERDHERCQAN